MEKICRKDEYWVAKMRMIPHTRTFSTVINIYRIDEEGDIAFTMCGDEDVYWHSQFEHFELVNKIEV